MHRHAAFLPILLVACQEYTLAPGRIDVNPGLITACDFSRVGNTSLYAYDCNPVFTTTGEGWADEITSTAFHVTDVMGHPYYQLWYVASRTNGRYAMGYAVSDNGTAWTALDTNPVLAANAPGAWDGTNVDGVQVVWHDNTQQYVMAYQGLNLDSNQWGLGAATSADGRQFTRVRGNPVVDFTAGGANATRWCWPLGLSTNADGDMVGFLAGSNPTADKCHAYGLLGTDPNTWTTSPQPLLRAGEAGAWDAEGFTSLASAELNGTRHVFYVGFGAWEDFTTYRVAQGQRLGYAAVSEVGTIERRPNPIPLGTPGDQNGGVRAVAAQTVGPRILLWITDTYATDDGDVSGVGYYLFDPERAAGEDGEAPTE